MAMWELDSERRLAALEEVDIFPGVPEESFAVYTRLVGRLLNAPAALVTFVSDECQFFPASVGMGEPWATRGESPLERSICQHVVRNDAALIIDDAEHNDLVKNNPAVLEGEVKAYIGVPLRAPGGEPLGSLCAVDSETRQWSESDLAILHDLAEAVGDAIALRVSEHRRAHYASVASHELRTPLTALRLELDDLASFAKDTDVVAVVRGAIKQVEKLSTIADDLTTMAQAGPLQEIEIDLFALAYEVASAHQLKGTPNSADLVVEGETVMVHTSLAVLRYVVNGLVGAGCLTNAARVVVRVGESDRLARLCVEVPADVKVPDEIPITGGLYLSVGARIVVNPRPGVAYELVLPAI